MEKKSTYINLQSTVSYLLKTVESEVSAHFAGAEEHLFDVFLNVIGFSSFQDFLVDVESFLTEEIDFTTISHDNVSGLNFNILASKFGKRYSLRSLSKTVRESELSEFQMMGWKATRIILIAVVKPELQSMSFQDAQRLVLTLHDFINSYSIIQGVRPNAVLDEIQFWDAFNDYKFTLELDDEVSKQLPTDEFLIWHNQEVSCEKCAGILNGNELIVNKNEWVKFFEDHTSPIQVVEGRLQYLVAVLYQMELKHFFIRNKGKGCWKIWQLKLVDKNGDPFSRELRKISSKINAASNGRDKSIYQFAKGVVRSLFEDTTK